MNPLHIQAEELGAIKKADSKGLILGLKSIYPIVRITARDRLIKKGRSVVKSLIPVLKEDLHWRIKSNIARILGLIKNKQAVEPLLEALHDKDRHLRQATAWALGEIENKKAIEPLINLLEKEEDWDVRECAEDALSKLREKSRFTNIIEFLKK